MFHQLLRLPSVFSPLSAAAHNISRFRVILGAEFSPLYHSAVAKASSATASPPTPPRQPLLLLLLLLLLLVSILRKFLTVKNRLSVVMTSPRLSSLLHTRSKAECPCVGSMEGRELAVIMALVLSVTGHLRGRRSSAGCGGRRCCSNVFRELASFLFRIDQHSCSFEYLFTPRQQSNGTYIKKYPQIVAHGRSPIDQSVYFPRRPGNTW